MKAKLYKVHRVLSLILFLPIVLWSLSGLLHPIMANWFRIQPAQRHFVPHEYPADTTRMALKSVCELHSISTIENAHLVHLNHKETYQVKYDNLIHYYDAHTGKEIQNGDEQYATFLARYYLGDSLSEVTSIEVISDYTGDYKVINRLLPVHKVSFDRNDQMDVFVHTESGGLGTLNDKYRKAYLWAFSTFHNWNFLGKNVAFKSTVILIFSILVFFNGLIGLWIYWKNRKAFSVQKKANPKLAPRKRHRKFSLFTSIFLLAFSFSGGYHTLQKYGTVKLNDLAPEQHIQLTTLNTGVNDIINDNDTISSFTFLQYAEKPFIRVSLPNKESTIFYDMTNGKPMENGDEKYAQNRAVELSGHPSSEIISTTLITNYNRSYGFINKRLPVYEVKFNTENQLAYYIEPSTGIPGAINSNENNLERFSFLFLHKYHFLDFMGKGWRDLIMSLCALTLVFISITGIIIWLKMRKRKSKPTVN